MSDLVLGGQSPAIERLREQIRKLARRREPVLVMGETGVGKERVVRSLHATSSRANGPFVVVSAGALPGELIEAELFGHEEGAFTDAKERRIGRIEEADGGTLFLDGINDLDLRHQASLLRVLETGRSSTHRWSPETSRCSNHCEQPRRSRTGCRCWAFSRRSLPQDCRPPSLHPPLRERMEDLPLVLADDGPRTGSRKGLIDLLSGERWPGNFRQLRNFLQRLELLQEPDEKIVDLAARELAHRRRERSANRDWLKLPLEELVRMRLESAMPVDRPLPDGIYEAVLAEVERALLGLVMERVGGKQIQAAKHLGINRNTLRKAKIPGAFVMLKSGVYLIWDLDTAADIDPVDFLKSCAPHRPVAIQLRAKGYTTCPRRPNRLIAACLPAQIPLIVNDRIEWLQEGCAGLHLGQDDGPSPAIEGILGRSTHTIHQVRVAVHDPKVDHLGFGPIALTTSKSNAYNPVGLINSLTPSTQPVRNRSSPSVAYTKTLPEIKRRGAPRQLLSVLSSTTITLHKPL